MPITHGHRLDGNRRSPTYNSWRAMNERCYYPPHPRYADYGGRGIQVCDRWRGDGGFANFLADVGVRPAGMTLDRIDVNGNYEPGNVQWATPAQQTWNRRCMRRDRNEFADEPQLSDEKLLAAASASTMPF